MNCGRGFLKTWLVIFNILFFLVGVALIIASAIVLVDKSVILQVFSYAPDSVPVTTEDLDNILSQASYLKQAAYGIIGLGGFIFLVGFCGCCGACKESKCLLGVYGVVVLIILIAQLAGGILAYVFKEKAKSHLKEFGLSTMKSYEGTTLADGKLVYPDDVISQAWDIAQVSFKCCGMDAAKDWETQNVSLSYTVNSNVITSKIPVTCCVMTGMENFPEGLDDITITNAEKCLQMEAAFYNDGGCYDAIYNLAMKYGVILLGVCAGLLAFELFNAVFAFLLMRSISKDGESA